MIRSSRWGLSLAMGGDFHMATGMWCAWLARCCWRCTTSGRWPSGATCQRPRWRTSTRATTMERSERRWGRRPRSCSLLSEQSCRRRRSRQSYFPPLHGPRPKSRAASATSSTSSERREGEENLILSFIRRCCTPPTLPSSPSCRVPLGSECSSPSSEAGSPRPSLRIPRAGVVLTSGRRSRAVPVPPGDGHVAPDQTSRPPPRRRRRPRGSPCGRRPRRRWRSR